MNKDRILSSVKSKQWDKIPNFDKLSRQSSITLGPDTRKLISRMAAPSKVGYILQEAYFKSKGRFFNVKDFNSIDQRYAEKLLGLTKQNLEASYTSSIASNHKNKILNKFRWNRYSEVFEKQLNEQASRLVNKRNTKPDIIYALLSYCWSAKIEIPSYKQLQEIINNSYSGFEDKLFSLVKRYITEEQENKLKTLYDGKKPLITNTEYKRVNQSDAASDLSNNARIIIFYKDIHIACKPILKDVAITKEATEDFSNWVKRSTITQLTSLSNSNKRNLYLISFVKDQLFTRQDYAVDAILNITRQAKNQANRFNAKLNESNEKRFIDDNQDLCKTTKNTAEVISKIIEICQQSNIKPETKINRILALAEAITEAELEGIDQFIGKIETSMSKRKSKGAYYRFLFEKSVSIQRRISELVQSLEFSDESDPRLLKHIKFLKKGKSFDKVPSLHFLTAFEKNLVSEIDDIPQLTKYKVLLFLQIADSLRDKSLTLKFSYRFLNTKRYLVPDEFWGSKKIESLISVNLFKYRDPEKVLDEIGGSLTKKYVEVNNRISKGLNPYFKTTNGGWNIEVPKTDYSTARYIPFLLGENKSLLLYELIYELDKMTSFSNHFQHLSIRHSKEKFNKKHLYAAIMSIGTNMGHNLMSKAARNITVKELRDLELNRFSKKNLIAANDEIIKLIQSLPLPTIYNNFRGQLHTSSDGKKIPTAVNSLLANYSYKYYGKEQGVSANSFIDEKQSFFHINVLTSSDREAPYMLEGIVDSKKNLFPENEAKHMHSTDTHGFTEAIFAGLFFQDVSFAPRIKKVNKQTLYGYESKSLVKNSGFKLGPKSTINKKLIIDHWDTILRLMTSIKMDYASASQLFTLLSSSSKDTQLYKAVKEFGRLLKSHFILCYVDDLQLRQSINKQLNRVELGQKLSSSVFNARGQKLYVGRKEEIENTMLCKTLLKNIVIAWNYLYLSDHLLTLPSQEMRDEIIDSINKGSVISWEHINMSGIFDFDHIEINTFESTLKEMMKLKIT